MEATVLSVGKSVLNGALSYAKSAAAEEVALQLGVRRDKAFITDELEMMQGFLMVAHDERDDNKVVKIWVKQVRDVSYDVEDCLQDFAVHLEKPSWWRIPRTLLHRRRVAKQMKELRAKVEDVSQRNVRYQLIKGSRSKLATSAEASGTAGMEMFGIDDARIAAKHDKEDVDLLQLIKKQEDYLRVISLWGTIGNLGHTTIIRAAYENEDIKLKFPCRAWVRVMHPFSAKELLQNLLHQFYTTLGVGGSVEIDKTWQDLAEDFKGYMNKKSCLIVLTDLSTIEEWDQIKACFTDSKNGSRIIVSTKEVEVASLCAGQGSRVSELKQLSNDQTIYAFYEKDSQSGPDLMRTESSSSGIATSTDNKPTSEIVRDQSTAAEKKSATDESPSCMMDAAIKESHFVGREKDKIEIIKLISNQATQQLHVISVWGMGGLGKTTLIKHVYQSEELNSMYENRAFVTVMRPFVLEELIGSLVIQLDVKASEKDKLMALSGGARRTSLSLVELKNKLAGHLEGKKCLIVIDDLSSPAEWDQIVPNLSQAGCTSRIIVTTRERSIAKHCSEKEENIYPLKVLDPMDARSLFMGKVFKKKVDLDKEYPELIEQAELILKKCSGLPLAIVTIGAFLEKQPKTVVEWRMLNEHISAELEMNPELGIIRAVLMKSYNGLPYHLKPCFLYLPIFPEDQNISRRRLVRRWTAEGYSRELSGKSAQEMADSYFMDLISRSMILPSTESIYSRKGFDSCHVHDLIREISISESREENLVGTLEEGCSLNTLGTARHLSVSSNWERDQSEFESMVDMSRLRSITVFGRWQPFFISDKMRMLRVLDLEDTTWGLRDHHLVHIGKLLHLKYFSLRGCSISHLPNSLGKLRQLETLDVRDTEIVKLPESIINLRKLNYLLAGSKYLTSYQGITNGFPKLLRNRLCVLAVLPMALCVTCCSSWVEDFGGSRSSRDVCTNFCCAKLPTITARLDGCGVLVPRGMNKLKALHTLGIVNIAQGKDILQDIRRLTQLRKLGVSGINKRNGEGFCSVIAGLDHLESLSVQSEGDNDLSVCLDGMPSPPKHLESLKLRGNMAKLPDWTKGLQNLVKLKLEDTKLAEHDDAMQVIGDLPKLSILRMLSNSFQGEELRFKSGGFESLTVLEIHITGYIYKGTEITEHVKSVKFDQGAVVKLEQLMVTAQLIVTAWMVKTGPEIGFFGLESLPSINRVSLGVGIELDSSTWIEIEKASSNHETRRELYQQKRKPEVDRFVEPIRAQLTQNPTKPILKLQVY